MSVEELVSFANDALAGYAHRRIDVEDIVAAELLRPGLEARGWKTIRLLWMRHEASPPGPEVLVEEVSYDAVNDLRVAWHQEENPSDQDAGEYQQQERDVALRRGVQVLAVRSAGEPVAFAQLARNGREAEIAEVYVDRRHRGAGLGTAAVIGLAVGVVGASLGGPSRERLPVGVEPRGGQGQLASVRVEHRSRGAGG